MGAFLGGRLHELLKERRVLSKVRLVHGLVDGQSAAKGTRHGHAWVEADGIAYDFSNRRKFICQTGDDAGALINEGQRFAVVDPL